MNTTLDIGAFLKGFIRARSLAVDNLTGDQLAEALLQALSAGDFQRNLRVDNSSQQVVYTPYREVESLRAQYNELLYTVEQKFPGESRHQTALRYIQEREAQISHDRSQAENKIH